MNIGTLPLQENIPLHDKNSFSIGGSARWYLAPRTTDEVVAAIQWSNDRKIPLFVIGRGSNLLISDRGLDGLVLHLTGTAGEESIAWDGEDAEISGGVPLNTLVTAAVRKGFAGIEELAGIPGTVGGAVTMNAGAFSQCIADTLESVLCCNRNTGILQQHPAAALELGYRRSALQQSQDIVVSARFHFSSAAPPDLLDRRRKEILDRRKNKQPLNYPNCGSVFKRPPGCYAGTLIEQCGLKGFKNGGAAVSEKHANFIVNTGGATAVEVRHLIKEIQQRVYRQFSVLLEPEVIFMGDFEEPLFIPSEEH